MFVGLRTTNTISAAARPKYDITGVMVIVNSTASVWRASGLPRQLMRPPKVTQRDKGHGMSAVARPAIARAAKSRAGTAEAIVVTAVSPLTSANGIVVFRPALAIKRVRVADGAQTSAFVTDTNGTVLPVQATVSSVGSKEHGYLLSVAAGKSLAVAALLLGARTSGILMGWSALAIPGSQWLMDWESQ